VIVVQFILGHHFKRHVEKKLWVCC